MRPALFCLILAACSSPSPKYLGIQPMQTTVDGWRIDVYRKGDQVQAIRVNAAVLPNATQMTERARVAIEGVTGCKIAKNSLKGDSNVANARLNCR